MKAAAATEPIDALIAQLEAQIALSESLGLDLTKLLLSMARLDLKMQRHKIGGAELSKLCALYERSLSRSPPAISSNSGGRKAKRPVSAVESTEAELSAGNGARSVRAAASESSSKSARPSQIEVSFGRRHMGSRKARRR